MEEKMSDKDIKEATEAKKEQEVQKDEPKMRRRRKGSVGAGKEGKISSLKRYATDKNYKYHVFNDDEYRIHQKTEEDDWDFVKDEKGQAIKKPVGTNPDGSVKYGILCKKRREWYDEDKAQAQEELDRTEKELLKGTNEQAHGTLEADKTYIPVQDGKAENKIEEKITRRKKS